MNIKSLCTFFVLFSIFAAWGENGWSSANPGRNERKDFSGTIWYENFSGSELPFTVEFCEGAKGTVEVIPSGGRNGTPALRTVKSSNSGFIVIRFKQKIAVKPGDKLQFNGFYQGKKSIMPYSLAMFRLQLPGQKDFPAFSFYPGINGGHRLQQLLPTANNTWERKFTQRQAQKGMDFFQPVIILAGHASEAVWDDLFVENDDISAKQWEKTLKANQAAKYAGKMISKEKLAELIEKMADRSAKVVSINGKTRMLMDGRIIAPVINGAQGNADKFGAAGVNLVRVGIRLGEGKNKKTYPGCWKSKDVLNIDQAVEKISSVLRSDPEARIILAITLHPYWEFTKDHPSEAWIGKKGFPLFGNGIHLHENELDKPRDPDADYAWPSYQSEILIDLYKKQMAKIIEKLKELKYLKAVVGIHIGGGHDNQLGVPHFDYSAPAVKQFRNYLQEIYKDNAALQKAWNDPAVTFETAKAPVMGGNNDCFDVKTQRNRIDFYRFSKIAPWRRAGEIADYAKKIIGKDIIAIRWGQNPFCGTPDSSPAISDFLYNQKFDILVEQAPYNDRPPASSCIAKVPLDSFHLNGKMFVNEFDIRTWCATPHWEKEIMSITWGLVLDPPMWRSVNRKLAGSMFAHDMGFWYLDMAPGWFDHPEILADIKSVNATGCKVMAMPPSKWKKDTALIIDDEGYFLRNLPGPQWMFDITTLLQHQLFGFSGVPFAFYTLNDLLRKPELAKDLKVMVFIGMYEIDQRRQKLIKQLKNSNRTLIFLSGSGRLGGAKEALGMEIKYAGHKVNHDIVNAPGVKGDFTPLWRNQRLTRLKCEPEWFDYIPIVYAVPGSDAEVLARFAENNQPAVVKRQGKNYRIYYFGESGGLSPSYFNKLVREAGAYAAAPAGFQCETNGNFLSLHSSVTGKITLQLPYKCNAVNLFSGEKFTGVTSIELETEAGKTHWFQLIP
ncbi:MAG: beta-galactosidase [Lentisphaeria bacterium]|nr:beta-galactosidase [Lentisphaeria bacterium]